MKIKGISIVIAMAGSGTRTSEKYDFPKPLILLKDKPLFAWALGGLPIDLASEIRVITNRNVASHPQFNKLMEKFMPSKLKVSVEVLKKQTSGQAETVLQGSKGINQKNGILIYNCDTVISDNFPRDFEKWDGLIGSFKSCSPGLSYLETIDNKVIRTVEKQVISDNASTGLYYFGSLELFEKAFIGTKHQKESYVAPIYNALIQNGLQVSFFDTKVVYPLGTPEEIESFKKTNFLDEKR